MPNWPVPAGHSNGLAVATGRAVSWHEAGWPKFLESDAHAFATREVVSAPNAGVLGASPGNPAWRIMRGVSIGVLADAALMVGCAAFEVRYVVTPSASGSARVQIFLTAKARSRDPVAAQAAVAAACEKLPAGFSWETPQQAQPLADAAIGMDGVVVELRRDEEVTLPQYDFIPADFYYQINDDPGDGSGWPGFWRTLANVSDPVTVSLLFHPTELNFDERNILGGIVTDLAQLSQARTDYDIMGNPVLMPSCENAGFALESWKARVQRLHRPLLARLAVRSEITTAVTVATAMATAIGVTEGVAGSHPMYYEAPRSAGDVRQANFGFDWLEILPWGGHGIWEDRQAPHSLRRMPYLFGLNEAASLMVLPVPDEQGVAGMPLARSADARRGTVSRDVAGITDGVRLGRGLHQGSLGGEIVLPIKAINRHMLIVGSSGSGKTTTVLSILTQLWRDHGIPFTVLESVKTEYRSLIETSGLEDLNVITIGNESVAPLRLNPLAPPQGVRCEVHQSTVLSSLKMALPLFPPLPQLLAKAISQVYERAGWDDETTTDDGLVPPTLRDLLGSFRQVFAEVGYVGEAKNIGLAFETRLDGLLQGGCGKLLDTVSSTNFDELLRKPLVIELNDVKESDERAVIAAFLLDRIRASAQQRSGSGGQLRHVTVIEEAHELLAKANQHSGNADSGAQAKADSVNAFCNAIAVLRAYGEGFILSSQSPAELADAAVKNTGTRIAHKMEDARDRNRILNDFGANDELRTISSELQEGEAIARWPQLDEIELLKVIPDAAVDSGRKIADKTVAEYMSDLRDETRLLMPYQMCTTTICVSGCQTQVRKRGKSIADLESKRAEEIWTHSERTGVDGSETIARLLASRSAYDPQQTYCAAAHLSVLDVAFRHRPYTDDRPKLARIVERAIEEGGTR